MNPVNSTDTMRKYKMSLQYKGAQRVVELANGKKVLLLNGSILKVEEIDAQLQSLISAGLLTLIGE